MSLRVAGVSRPGRGATTAQPGWLNIRPDVWPDVRPDIIHGSYPWILSMDIIHGYYPVILTTDIIHGYHPWIISIDFTHGIP